jgi:hypothetical protein
MGCLLVAFALILPRAAIVLIFLFTRWFEMVFSSWIWPVLGFIFLPYTTLAYTAASLNTGGNLTLGWLILIIIAVVVDVGHWGGGYRVRRRSSVLGD